MKARSNYGIDMGRANGISCVTGGNTRKARVARLCVPIIILAMLLSFMGGCRTSAPAGGGSTREAPAPVVPAPPQETFTWPFTGEETGDPFAVRNVPLSVKIENSEAARPQTGLNAADVVYETMVEGGETRFNCIFQSRLPGEVGPVRSARLSDLWIVPQYQGLFFYSGANVDVVRRIKEAGLPDMSHSAASAIYHRVSFRAAPHNLYLKLNGGHDIASAKGMTVRSDKLSPLDFGPIKSDSSVTASAITLNFGGRSNIRWDWNAEQGVYLRSQGGKALMDAMEDSQVRAKNVAVLYADYAQQPTLDPAGSPTYDTTLGGTGKAVLFREGNKYECTWTADRNTPPKLTDAAGNPIPLNPGRTWFEVLPARGSLQTE